MTFKPNTEDIILNNETQLSEFQRIKKIVYIINNIYKAVFIVKDVVQKIKFIYNLYLPDM